MANNPETGRTAVIVSLAAFRAARRERVVPADPTGRRLIALRLPSPRALAHRRRMLEHLAAQS